MRVCGVAERSISEMVAQMMMCSSARPVRLVFFAG